MLFPNFTSRIINAEIISQFVEPEGRYDNFVAGEQRIDSSCSIDLMMKFSQFLKVSSGTYNL